MQLVILSLRCLLLQSCTFNFQVQMISTQLAASHAEHPLCMTSLSNAMLDPSAQAMSCSQGAKSDILIDDLMVVTSSGRALLAGRSQVRPVLHAQDGCAPMSATQTDSLLMHTCYADLRRAPCTQTTGRFLVGSDLTCLHAGQSTSTCRAAILQSSLRK